jgi:hypothetical protein
MTPDILEIDALLADPSPEANHRRQIRAHLLWSKSREAKAAGNPALADRLKRAGNALVRRNCAILRS